MLLDHRRLLSGFNLAATVAGLPVHSYCGHVVRRTISSALDPT
jgi:hypothetical protein